MTPRIITTAILILLLPALTLQGEPLSKELKVRLTHYGYPGDPHASNNTRLGLGDHNNILNPDSVAVSPDLDRIFPFGSKVVVNGEFIGFRHDTMSPKFKRTIAVYDPQGQFTSGHGDVYIQVPAKTK
jgi:3D (Asp-Asp-Asp) domain-containing protein